MWSCCRARLKLSEQSNPLLQQLRGGGETATIPSGNSGSPNKVKAESRRSNDVSPELERDEPGAFASAVGMIAGKMAVDQSF